MQVKCTHCGGPNQAPDGARSVAIACAACGRSFTTDAGVPALGRVPLKKVAASSVDNGFGSLGSSGGLAGLGGLGDLGPPAPGPDFGSLGGGSSGSLGEMPTETDADAFDLSSILSPTTRSSGAQPLPPPPNADFTFGGTMDKFSALQGMPGGGEASESTRVVDVDAAAAFSSAPEPTQPNEPVSGGWRVRSERGLVYELMTVDAVVAWLEGKADISGVRIASGGGEFQSVEAFPAIASRLGLRTSSAQPIQLSSPAGAGELSLAMERAPAPRSRQPQTTAAGGAPKKGARERPDAKPKEALRVDNPLGMGALLGLLIGALALAGGAVFAGVKTGSLDMPPPLEATAEAPLPPPSTALAAAVEDYNNGKINLAERRLSALAKKGDDPRAWRYLALALHKSNRDDEARAALARYRRRMQQTGGDGRQVREVQH